MLEIDANNKVHIKFNDHIVEYEIPDELHGTTFGKIVSWQVKLTLRHHGKFHDDDDMFCLQDQVD